MVRGGLRVRIFPSVKYHCVHSLLKEPFSTSPSALKGLGFITFETWLTYFDWGSL